MAFASKNGVDDMVMLSDISNGGINSNLKKRYDHDQIYTYIGHVLISVNPFKLINGLYGDKVLRDYKGKYKYELPPHVYAMADDMYRSMLNERENQCVIISGESGAGKTEASKKIMQFIAAVSGSSPAVQHVKDVILESNPLLEAFGNAKTIRNNNSSRFGKYMEIQFDIGGDPEGGRINNYLLEKSRVVYQQQNERNFHIFYQLIAGTSGQQKQDMGLSSPDYFHYLNQGKCFTVDTINDVQEFNETTQAMKTMNFSQNEIDETLRLLSAILYLGNIAFVNGAKDAAQIQDPQVTDMFAYLIQSDAQSCGKALCYRTISTGTEGRSARVSTYACPQQVEGAIYSRDALAKALYSRLFDWVIKKVNTALGWANDSDCLTLGILDIYGFEIFGKNGFEQFCINYVNEKLQQIFIQLTLKAEQEEYKKEGIKWTDIPFFNNQICCELIESKKPIGILTLLDDVCNFPKGTDEKFLQRCGESYNNHEHFGPGLGANEFVIKHYAGDVSYNAEGFVDKNKDLLFNDLIDLAHTTGSQLITSLFPEAKTSADKRRPTTAGFKIKTSINELVAALNKCQPHYIRCIKPNEKKKANDFNSDLCMHQVKYLGLLENVRVRRAGFAYRQFYDKFFYRYRVCSSETWPSFSGSHQQGTQAILRVIGVDASGFQEGKTKIFIKAPESVFALEELRERKVFNYANTIQRFFLKFSLSNYYYAIQKNGNDKIIGKKERRKNSVERDFKGDYIGYRTNFPLKAIIESNGREKLLFGDRVNKYDRRLKAQRRSLLLTDQAIYIIAIDKNKSKDKMERQKKPWVYIVSRRIPTNQMPAITFSSMADNFFILHVPSQYDNLLECRRKVEFMSTLLKHNPQLDVRVSDMFNLTIKEGKKQQVMFEQNPSGGSGTVKGKKILVSAGLPKSTQPNLKEPAAVPTVVNDPYANRKQNAAPSRSGPASSAASSGKPQCKALYNFDAENPDELTFTVGAMIDIVEKTTPEWWTGSYNGATGIFPANYVEEVKLAAPAPSPMRAPTPSRSSSSAMRPPTATATPSRVSGPIRGPQATAANPARRGPGPQRGPGPARRGPGPQATAANPARRGPGPQRGPGPARRGPGPVRRG